MPNVYRIYEFKQPNPDWKDSLIKVLGIFALIFFAWVILNGFTAVISTLSTKLITIPIFIFSLVLHEMSHAYMADFLGDPSPRLAGRLSFNPLKHLDIWGTILFIFSGLGWAKPVQVDSSNFRDPNKAMVSVALAGPLSNLAIAIAAALLFKTFYTIMPDYRNFLYYLYYICLYTCYINVTLALFNMIPFPPLDGSRLVHYLLPAKYKYKYYQLQEYSLMIFIFLFMFAGQMITPAVNSICNAIWKAII